LIARAMSFIFSSEGEVKRRTLFFVWRIPFG
jgi:hypothetical protein